MTPLFRLRLHGSSRVKLSEWIALKHCWQSQILSRLHVPAIPATKHLINRETLSVMKSTAKILNFAREEIVSTDDMVKALETGVIAGYICDFPTPEFLGNPKIIAMPHIGASTAEAEENCAVMAANQLMDYIENGNIHNSVNFPPTKLARNGGARLTFLTKMYLRF